MLWWTLQQLKSSNPEVRAEAARKLAASGDRKTVPALIRALGDEDPEVRVEVAKAVGSFVHPAAIDPLATALSGLSRTAKSRRAASGKDPESAEYEALATALGRQGPPATTALVGLLRSDDKEARRWAAYALGLTRDARAIGPLAERLEDNRSEVRKAAAQALGDISDPGAAVHLKKALASRDPETRRVAAAALGTLGGEAAAEALISASEDENEAVQLAAIDALRRIGGIRAGMGLRRAIEAGKKKVASDAAAAALRSMTFTPSGAAERAAVAVLVGDFPAAVREGDAAAEALVEALGSRDERRRLQAVEALALVRSARTVPPLVNALRDHSADVREGAARALALLGKPAAGGLTAALESPDAVVERLAARALGEIGDARAAGPLASVIARNRSATVSYLEPLEAAREAAEAAAAILRASAARVNSEDLERLASVPDCLLEHPEGETEEARRPERVVDCTQLRELARRELDNRGKDRA